MKVLKEKDKIQFILKTLESLYPNPEIPLDHENNFTFLVAVMLSAQSTDKKVNEITPSLFKTANSAKKMSKVCLLYTSPSPRDGLLSRMPSSA